MRIAIISILSVLFLGSCATYKVKKKDRICSTCPVRIVRQDSVVTVLKDSTIFITIPGSVQYLENPCSELCDSLGNLRPEFVQEFELDNVRTVLKVVHDTVHDTLKLVLEKATGLDSVTVTTKTTEKYSSEVRTEKAVCDNERTWFDGLARRVFYLVLAYILLRWLKWKFKLNLPFIK